ncbi:MAG TPA: YfhO family protein [Thermoanaerobaculia bacterium]|nr:YfhO family protein [Thermoanaerobaculia bacterium]
MNPTWLYLAIVYAGAVGLARRCGAELPRRIALFFYLLVLLFFFRPLAQGYVNFHLDVLPSIPPWYHVTNYHHQFTSELNDLPMQIVPWMHQVRESWKSLEPPLWNHFSGSGYPLLGNGQSSAFSVLRFLTLPLPLGRAVAAEAAMKILIALTFTFLFCRRRYSIIGSTVAAVTFGFGGFIISWLHFPMVTAACLAPAVLYAIELLAERRTRGRVLFAALVWTQLLFAGHPETAAHIFWLGAVYTLWLILVEKKPWRLLLTLGGALAISALLAAPYLGPLLETMPRSKRVAELKEMPPSADSLPYTDRNCAIVMFQPHFFGQVPWEKAWGPSDTEPLGGFPGMFGWIAWIAVALHVIVRREWRSRELFFAMTTLFIIGVIYSWPGMGESFHFMMPIAAHARARMLFTLLCAIQTAAAIDLVRRVPMLTAALAAAAMLIVLLRIPMHPYRFETAVLGMLPGIAVIVGVIAFALSGAMGSRWATMALLVLVIADLFHVGRDRSMPLPDRMLYPTTPLIAKLQELQAASPEPFRITGIAAQFFPNLSAIYGLEDIRAHDPMSNAKYLAFLKLTADYEPWNYFAFLNDANKPVFDFLNVRYVVLDPGAPVTDPDRYAIVYDGRDGRILENRNVMPRFFAVRNVLLEFRKEVFYPQLRAHRDWTTTALLDDLKTDNAQLRDDFFRPRPDDGPLASAKIVKASPTEYSLRASAPRWSLVVSSIPWWPGWNVEIEGKRVEPIRVNAVFLGFAAPPGEHDVRVWYSPLSFWIGVWVAVGTVVAVAAAIRKRRLPPHSIAI